MPASDVFVSVIAPLQDDADVLPAFVTETMEVLEANYTNFELVLVDDGSTDQTNSTVEALLGAHRCIRFLRLARRHGLESAIAAGLDSVIGDYTVLMLPAMDPPALIPDLVARARAGNGVVFGVRTDRPAGGGWASASARLFWSLGRRYLDLQVPENATYLQCLSRNAVNALTRIRDKYRSVRLLASRIGADVQTVSYVPLRRRSGVRTRGLLASLDLAAGIVVSQSTRPLRFVSLLGLLAGFVNLSYMAYVVFVFLTHSHVAEGWTTTSLQVSGMFFLLFVILAVLSEYVGRVLEESRDRPLYNSLEERNSNVMVKDADRRNVVKESA